MKIAIGSLSGGMSMEQIYSLARQVGFPPSTAVSMTAIAWRESAGNPSAFRGVEPEASYGLWQINMAGTLGPYRRALFGISSNDQLFDPVTNARAAYTLWGGNDANLSRDWYIDRYGTIYGYAEKYQAYLPQAQAAAAAVDGYSAGGGGGYTPDDSGAPAPTSADSSLGLDFSDPTTMIAAAALGVGALLLLTSG